jgi:hypothetical protein
MPEAQVPGQRKCRGRRGVPLLASPRTLRRLAERTARTYHDKDKLSGVTYLKADDLPPEHLRVRRMLLGMLSPPPRATPAETRRAVKLARPRPNGDQMKIDNEDMARRMADDEDKTRRVADAIFMFALEDEDDDLTKEQADRLYERCLAEAYHMVVDEDYAELVRLGGAADVT